jgi:hypothetical protein
MIHVLRHNHNHNGFTLNVLKAAGKQVCVSSCNQVVTTHMSLACLLDGIQLRPNQVIMNNEMEASCNMGSRTTCSKYAKLFTICQIRG